MKLRFFPFELSIAWKYLIPKKRSLSSSLISLLSIFVITLVVWLIVVFLSVTTGIEKNWLSKLTSLQAPIRIYPTEAYFQSYYYLIDNFSSGSSYELKSIGEKAISTAVDPYNPAVDMELPSSFPKKVEIDPVKTLFSSLQELKKEDSSLTFQEYETTAALLKMRVNNNTVLSQVNYIASFPSENPHLSTLLLPPTEDELRHSPHNIYSHIKIDSAESMPFTTLPSSFFTEEGKMKVYIQKENNQIQSLFLTDHSLPMPSATLHWKSSQLTLQVGKKSIQTDLPVILYEPFPIKVLEKKTAYPYLSTVQLTVQNNTLKGLLPLTSLEIAKAEPIRNFSSYPEITPLWPHFVKGKGILPSYKSLKALLLPKSYKKQGVTLWSKGNLVYSSQKSLSGQEQQIPFYVAGFYDPGVLPVGGRFLFADSDTVRTISAQSPSISIDGTPTNGVFVWNQSIEKAPLLAKKIESLLSQKGIDKYWKVESFCDFSFSKEMLQQFQSDKTLFILLACIIILVACSNIISFLILLVSDKKREIAILRSMGANSYSIAFIFGLIGAIIGSLGSLVGTLLGIFTLKNLHILTTFLEKIQGHTAFQPAFFGESLPNTLSLDAVWFIFFITPLLSLIAGLIPAIKASKISCSQTLREQG